MSKWSFLVLAHNTRIEKSYRYFRPAILAALVLVAVFKNGRNLRNTPLAH